MYTKQDRAVVLIQTTDTHTRTHTHTGPIALPGPLKWSVIKFTGSIAFISDFKSEH